MLRVGGPSSRMDAHEQPSRHDPFHRYVRRGCHRRRSARDGRRGQAERHVGHGGVVGSRKRRVRGASKGNAGVAVSYYGPPGTVETALINESCPRWEDICTRLSVPYRRLGAVMIALDDEQAATLETTLGELTATGVRGRLLSPREVRETEPLVTESCVGGLLMPDEGVIDPMALTSAFANLAAVNRVSIRLSSPVTRIDRTDSGVLAAHPDRHRTRAVRRQRRGRGRRCGESDGRGEPLDYWPRKGQYAVVDRAFAGRLRKIVFCTHSATTKGINVVPTTHGSALLGPTATDHDNPRDTSTDVATVEALIDSARRLVPALHRDMVIKTFAANRPASDEQFRLRFDLQVPNLLHCTDRSAGVSISPPPPTWCWNCCGRPDCRPTRGTTRPRCCRPIRAYGSATNRRRSSGLIRSTVRSSAPVNMSAPPRSTGHSPVGPGHLDGRRPQTHRCGVRAVPGVAVLGRDLVHDRPEDRHRPRHRQADDPGTIGR